MCTCLCRKQRRLLHLLARLDRQLSPPVPSSQRSAKVLPAQHPTQSTGNINDNKPDYTSKSSIMATSEPIPAHTPSWLRSESTNTQDFSSNMVITDHHDNTLGKPTQMNTHNSEIRRQLLNQQVDEHTEISVSEPNSRPSSQRPVSSRMSGIRGEIYSRQKSHPPSDNPLTSASDPYLPTCLDGGSHLPTFLDGVSETTDNSCGPQRLQTAVLAKGRRTLRLNSSGSDTCLVPCIVDDVTTPTLSHAEPDQSSTHFEPSCPCPHHLERQSVNECLESISKFDHLHLGQMGSNIEGMSCTPKILFPQRKSLCRLLT